MGGRGQCLGLGRVWVAQSQGSHTPFPHPRTILGMSEMRWHSRFLFKTDGTGLTLERLFDHCRKDFAAFEMMLWVPMLREAAEHLHLGS